MFKKILIALAIISLIGASVYSHLPKTEDVESYISQIAGTSDFQLLNFESAGNSYLYSVNNETGSPTSYITVSDGYGYGGFMTVGINWSLDGTITYLDIMKHRDDPPWINKLYARGFFEQYIDRQFNESLILGDDIDAVTSATISSNGVASAVQNGRRILANQLGESFPVPEQSISFGLPEILLILCLGGVVTIRSIPKLHRSKWPRYIMLLIGFAILGVWLTIPLSLTNFATWLTGSPPNIATSLIFYILVFGVLGLAFIFGKNFYCFWICPFAGIQEVTYKIGRGGIKPVGYWHQVLRKFRYVLLWLAVFLSLLLLTPNLSVFEPWGTLFSQSGTPIQWVLLFATITLSFFVYNIWCNYICPVGAVMDITLQVRKQVRKLWHRQKKVKN